MSKRLQVILQDPEYREIQRAARARHMSIAQWVRQALSLALRGEATDKPSRKLEAVRRAAQYGYPSGDIDQMLAEIEADAPGSAPLNCWRALKFRRQFERGRESADGAGRQYALEHLLSPALSQRTRHPGDERPHVSKPARHGAPHLWVG
jgi:hypothetical protein